MCIAKGQRDGCAFNRASEPDRLIFVDEVSFDVWHTRYQKSVAFHEAGHAVAFISADQDWTSTEQRTVRRALLYVEAMGILGGQVGLDRDLMDYSDFLDTEHPPIRDIDQRSPLAPLMRHAMEKDILSYLAGPYAQVAFEYGIQPCHKMGQIARGIEETGDDFAVAAAIHDEMRRIGSRLTFPELEQRTLMLVGTQWSAITVLANKLADACYLDGDEVYRLVMPSLRQHC